MSRFPEIAIAFGLFMAMGVGAAAAQDADAGEKLFAKCKACHMVGENAANRVGPHLNGIVGRAAGTVDGYRYSPALLDLAGNGLVWDEANLAAYLENPRGFMKGTRMAFAGLKKADDLTNVIAYLNTFDDNGALKAANAPAPADEVDEAAAPPDDQPETADGAGSTEAPSTGAGLQLGLGREATPDEVAAWDIDVRPDGAGLPKGRGTAGEGMVLYDEQCASCHGDFGEAIGRWPMLAGGQGTLENERPEKTIGSYWPYLSTVYDYVNRAMPFGNARSLSNDDVYALTAYLLYLNDVVDDEDFELSQDNFSSIRLPNEPNFVDDDRSSEPHYARKAEPCMSDCRPGKPEITMHAAVLDVTPEDTDAEGPPAGGID